MALEHAILVSLAERSATGYDLARRFDASIGNFWKASHQQIYKVLARMEAGGLVASDAVVQAGRPDKKVYSITAGGRDELAAYTREPTPPEVLRSELAVKVRALPFGDAGAVLEDVRRRRAHHEATLAHYEESAARFYPDAGALDPDALGGWLVLRGGILAEQTGIRWCEEMEAALSRVATAASAAR